MSRIFFAYLLHEEPFEQPSFCKIGVTSFPRMRFVTLQEGNPRQLVVWKHAMCGNERPGLPFPARKMALSFEFDLLFALEQRGNRLKRTYEFENPRPIAREWITGVDPAELWLHMLFLYEDYISSRRLEFELTEEWRQIRSSYQSAYEPGA